MKASKPVEAPAKADEPTEGSGSAAPDDKPAPCVKKDAIAEIWIAGDGVSVCYASDPRTCWQIDAAKGEFTSKDPAAWKAPDKIDTITVDATGIKHCKPDGSDCKTIATKDYKDGGTAIANADRTLVAAWAQGGAPMLRVYETRRGRVVYTVAAWSGPSSDSPSAIQRARFTGDTLVVWNAYTPVSSGARMFVAKSGKKLGDVGGKNLTIHEGEAVQLDGTKWLFAGFDEQKLFVHDVATGKLDRTIEIADEAPQLIGKLPDGRVIANGGRDVRVIDLTSGKLGTWSPPACN